MSWETVALADGSPFVVLGCQDSAGTTVVDAMGTPHNGTLGGTFLINQGFVGGRKSIKLGDASNPGYITIPQAAALDLDGALNWSLEFLIAPLSGTPGTFKYLASMDNPTTVGWGLQTGETGELKSLWGTTGGVGVSRIATGFAWNTSQLHLVVVISDDVTFGSRLSVYLGNFTTATPPALVYGPVALDFGVHYPVVHDTASGLRFGAYIGDTSLCFKANYGGIAGYASALTLAQITARFYAAMGAVQLDVAVPVDATTHPVTATAAAATALAVPVSATTHPVDVTATQGQNVPIAVSATTHPVTVSTGNVMSSVGVQIDNPTVITGGGVVVNGVNVAIAQTETVAVTRAARTLLQAVPVDATTHPVAVSLGAVVASIAVPVDATTHPVSVAADQVSPNTADTGLLAFFGL